MNVGAAFVADRQASEAVQPSDGSLNDPPADAQAAAVRRARIGVMPPAQRRSPCG